MSEPDYEKAAEILIDKVDKQAKRIAGLEAGQLDFAKEMTKIHKAKIQRIAELEAALQGMVLFIEDDFPRGTGKNHGTCATDVYQEACNAVIEALKGK